jgi:NAD(P) transhydrogenase subunit alpha
MERNGMFCRLTVVVRKVNHHQKPMEGKTMRIGVPKERLANETRVAATPKTVEQLLKLGFTSRLKAARETGQFR